MKIDNQTINYISELSRLEFHKDEKENIVNDLNRILEFVDKLNEVDTENIEPLIYMTDKINDLREDEIVESITQKEALKNAPDKDSDYFKVSKVLS